MEKGESEVRERKGRGGEEKERNGAMGVDPTKFGKKSMPVFIRLYYFEYNKKAVLSQR